MAKLLGPDFLNLQVRDLTASRAFYTELLGLTEDTSFTVPGVVLWIDCDHVNELHAKLETAGVTIIQQPFDGPFGRTCVFADPDGYRITANENPWDRFPLGGRKER